MKKGKGKIIVILTLLVGVGLFLLAYVYASRELPDSDKIVQNIKIDGQNVGNMSPSEAEFVLRTRAESLKNAKIIMEAGDKKVIVSAKEAGIICDSKEVAKSVKKAYEVGRKGFILKRAWDIRKAKKKGQNIILAKKINDENVKKVLKFAQRKLLKKTKDAYIVEKKKKPVIIKETVGQMVDMKEASVVLKEGVEKTWSGENLVCKIPVKKEYPRITAKVLAELSDKLGSFTTYYEKYDVDRCHNIENGTGFINKSLVNPGETFSVYKAVSPFSYEHGYLTAGAYENGLVVQRYGGGICQVATTLYNAAIRAEMKIVERHNHSMTIHYVPLSFDAAIAGADQDFRFQNNGKYPVYIYGKAGKGKITFTIYGKDTREKGRKIKFESRVLSTFYPVTKVVGKDPGLKKGRERVEFFGTIGHTAELWKKIYIYGKLKKQYKFNSSSYMAAPRRVIKGTKKEKEKKAKHKNGKK